MSSTDRPSRPVRVLEKRHRQDSKTLQESGVREIRSQCKVDWDRAQHYKSVKKTQQAAEKRALSYYGGGLAWGFDPNAGMLRPGHAQPAAAGETHMSVTKADNALDTSPSKPVRGHTWGIQFGNPSEHAEPGYHDCQWDGSDLRHGSDAPG